MQDNLIPFQISNRNPNNKQLVYQTFLGFYIEENLEVAPLVRIERGGIGGKSASSDIDRNNMGVGATEISAGDIEGLVGVTADVEMELDGAILALAIAIARVTIPREAHAHGKVAGEGDEAEAVGDELVVEDGGVDLNLDEINGNGGHLGDHHAAESVGHARIGVGEIELEVVVLHLSDSNLRESLV